MGGPLATAASVVIAFLLFWSHGGNGRALARELQEVGFATPVPFVGLWADPNDENGFRQAERAVAEARAELEEALAAGDGAATDPWLPWTKIYRNLRAMNQWTEALEEALAFLAYAEERNRLPERYTMYYTALSDVGGIYLAMGDYERAKAYLHDARPAARDYHEWFHRSGRSKDPRPHTLEMWLAGSVAPYLWTLSSSASAQGDQATAWAHPDQAGGLLRDFFIEDCAYRELSVRSDA